MVTFRRVFKVKKYFFLFRVGGYFDAEEVFLRLGCSVTPARHVEAGDGCRIFRPKGVESYVFT